MKKILLCSATLLLCAGQAMAVSGVYVAPKVGWSSGTIDGMGFEYRYSEPGFSTDAFTLATDDSNTNVVSWGGAVGYVYDKWLVPLRMETEYLYRNHYQFDSAYCTPLAGGCPLPSNEFGLSSTIDTQTLLANFYIDVPVTNMFALFFGVGAGAALSEAETNATYTIVGEPTPITSTRSSAHDYSFSWMGTAGVTVSPLKWLAFDVSYRYSDLGDVTAQVNNSITDIGAPDGYSSLSSYETENFTAQEVYLGVRMLIPNMYNKPKKHAVKHQYLDK